MSAEKRLTDAYERLRCFDEEIAMKPKYKLWRRVGTIAKWEAVHGPTDNVWEMLGVLCDHHNTDSKYDHRFVQYRIAAEEEKLN